MKVRLRKRAEPELHLVYGTTEDVMRGNGRFLVTALQARLRLGVSEGGFRLITSRGDLKPVAQLGKAELYFLDDVESFARSV